MGEKTDPVSSAAKGTEDRIRRSGIIAIIRGDYGLEQMEEIAGALIEGGVEVLEVTLNSTGALEAITALCQQFGGKVVVGAGTVRTVAAVRSAHDAGAEFIVAPNYNLQSIEESHTRNILHIPGIFTATEAQAAFAAGCRLVKLFPAEMLGPRYVKALRAPLDDIGFVPTGGISASNIADYVQAGAVAFGVGSSLVPRSIQSVDDIITRAKSLINALKTARDGKDSLF